MAEIFMYDLKKIKESAIKKNNDGTFARDIADIFEMINFHKWEIIFKTFKATDTLFAAIKEDIDNAAKSFGELYLYNETPEVVKFLRDYTEYFDEDICTYLSSSSLPEAMELLRENMGIIDWEALSENPLKEAIDILLENIDEIYWEKLSGNCSPYAIELLLKYPENIDWEEFCKNTSPKAIEYLRTHPENIDWKALASNSSPEALDLLLNLDAPNDNIYMDYLAKNENPAAIEYLRQWVNDCINTQSEPLCVNKIVITNETHELLYHYILTLLSNNRTTAAIQFQKEIVETKINYTKLFNNFPEHIKNKIIEIIKHNCTHIDFIFYMLYDCDCTKLSNNINVTYFWDWISKNAITNPLAVDILEEYPANINWRELSLSALPHAMSLMRKNLDKVYWYGLSMNSSPAALLFLFEPNCYNKICWHEFELYNENAYKQLCPYNYAAIKRRFELCHAEITQKVLKPIEPIDMIN